MKNLSKLILLLASLFVVSCGQPGEQVNSPVGEDKDYMIREINKLNTANNYTILTEPDRTGGVNITYSSKMERQGNVLHMFSNVYNGVTKEDKLASEIYMNFAKDEDKVYYYYLNVYSSSTKWDKQVYKVSENPTFAEVFEAESSYKDFFHHFIDDLNSGSYTYKDGTYSFTNFDLGEGEYKITYIDLSLKKENNDFTMTYAANSGGVKYSYTMTFTKLGTTSVSIPPEVING